MRCRPIGSWFSISQTMSTCTRGPALDAPIEIEVRRYCALRSRGNTDSLFRRCSSGKNGDMLPTRLTFPAGFTVASEGRLRSEKTDQPFAMDSALVIEQACP